MYPNPAKPLRRARPRLAGLALVAAAACGDATDEGRRTLVSLSTEPATAVVAEPITFRYSAEGENLVGVVVDYGDGARDSIPAFGAQTAAGVTTHAYEMPGIFQATAEAVEFSGRTARDSVGVEITAALRDH